MPEQGWHSFRSGLLWLAHHFLEQVFFVEEKTFEAISQIFA
jgi:hypothetical protein